MSDFKDAYEAGQAIPATAVRFIDEEIPFVVLQELDSQVVHSLEHYLAAPTAKRGSVLVHDESTLIAYVNAHKGAATRIFGDLGSATIVAVLDHHHAGDTPEGAGWGDHRVTLDAQLTKPWQTWIAANKRRMSQVDFAEFIENNLSDIGEPAGSTILELAQRFSVNRNASFDSAINLTSGLTQFTFQEREEKGTVSIPALLVLALTPFQGGESYRVQARLRYRIEGGTGKLSIWYDLVQPDRVIEDAFTQRTTRINLDTGIEVWMGIAPSVTPTRA